MALTPNDLRQIDALIQKRLSEFKRQELSFTKRRLTDTATDKKAAAPKQQNTGGYLATTGGTMTGGLVTANIGFYGTTAKSKQTVSGSKGSNAALTSLMSALATLGLVTDSTT